MASVVSCEASFTTGSFYHYLSSWPTHTRERVGHWMQTRTVRLILAH